MQTNENEQSPFRYLAKREQQIANYLLKGMKTKEIALMLAIKPNTVSTIKKNVFFKLGVGNLVELLRLAMEHHFPNSL